MSWKRHLTPVANNKKIQAAMANYTSNANQVSSGTGSNFNSYLPEVYKGPPNRIERYSQFDNMDTDPEVNFAVDTIADFCTQTSDKDNSDIFKLVKLDDEVTETEIEIIHTTLRQWTKINKFKQRIWRIFRNTLLYRRSILHS